MATGQIFFDNTKQCLKQKKKRNLVIERQWHYLVAKNNTTMSMQCPPRWVAQERVLPHGVEVVPLQKPEVIMSTVSYGHGGTQLWCRNDNQAGKVAATWQRQHLITDNSTV